MSCLVSTESDYSTGALGEITRVEEIAYAYRRFRGPDGRVYSLNEQK